MILIKKILNPIAFFSEFKVLIGGVFIASLCIFLCYEGQILMDGYLDLHYNPNKDMSVSKHIAAFASNVVIMIIMLWGTALIFFKKTRIIDILNVVLAAQWTKLFSIPFVYLTAQNEVLDMIAAHTDNLQNLQAGWKEITSLILFSIILLFLLIIHIISLYQGFKTASNSKKTIQKVLFFLIILIVEGITVYLTRGIIYY